MLGHFSPVWLWDPMTVAHQAPLFMWFSRQEYWSGLLCPSPGDLLDSGIKLASLVSPALQADSLPLNHWGSQRQIYCRLNSLLYYLYFSSYFQRSKNYTCNILFSSVQFSSVTPLCPTLCDPMNCSAPGLPVRHQLPEPTQTHAHWVSDAIQQSHPLSSPSPPAINLSQHQGVFKWVI